MDFMKRNLPSGQAIKLEVLGDSGWQIAMVYRRDFGVSPEPSNWRLEWCNPEWERLKELDPETRRMALDRSGRKWRWSEVHKCGPRIFTRTKKDPRFRGL